MLLTIIATTLLIVANFAIGNMLGEILFGDK